TQGLLRCQASDRYADGSLSNAKAKTGRCPEWTLASPGQHQHRAASISGGINITQHLDGELSQVRSLPSAKPLSGKAFATE
ncbi:MAG: hypothetical protein EBX64_10855, partial [Betaproteobacteria bacterium]|nr:hypothetical protein [Betaproteobacteria bacterium]